MDAIRNAGKGLKENINSLYAARRTITAQSLMFLTVLTSALMMYRSLQLWGNTESPIIVVLSGSMEPAFQRGDLLFLSLPSNPIEIGDICVFKIKGKEIPIVHRVVKVHSERKGGKQFLLTKGDNNEQSDRGGGIYNREQLWINKEDIVGCVTGQVPYVGMFTILMNDYQWLRYAFIGVLGVFLYNSE